MGMCTSCDVAPVASTTKVIMEDGKLREFSGPVTAEQVLRKEPGCFLCNADDMEFDDYPTAVGADDVLRPGQLYFVLPRSMLRRQLLAEDMAALAIKASGALVKGGAAAAFGGATCGGDECGLTRAAPAGGFSVGSRVEKTRRGGKASGGARRFSSELNGIPE